MSDHASYAERVSVAVGEGWNRFWFAPRDPRPLAVVRIAAACLALYAVATYWPDLDRLFGPRGMTPTAMVRELYEGQRSLLDYVPAAGLTAFWAATLALLACLAAGLGGRTVAIAAAATTISFFSRCPMVTGEFEAVLAMLLVYLCVGDSGAAWGVRTLKEGSLQTAASPLNTVSLRLIQIHVALIHLMIGWAQLAVAEGPWWSGEGVWLAASRPGMSLVNLEWLVDRPRLVALWSHAMLAYLLAMPIFVWRPLARPAVLVVGAVVWLAWAVASGWTMFSLSMLVGLAAFWFPATSVPKSGVPKSGKVA
jgi:hypothetical protein